MSETEKYSCTVVYYIELGGDFEAQSPEEAADIAVRELEPSVNIGNNFDLGEVATVIVCHNDKEVLDTGANR